MPKYLVRVSFTAEGMRELVRKKTPSGLRAAVAQLNEALGGRLEAFYFAFGEDDVVGIVEHSGPEAAAAVSVGANAAGLIRMKVTPLLTVEEMDRAVEKSGGLRMPGQA